VWVAQSILRLCFLDVSALNEALSDIFGAMADAATGATDADIWLLVLVPFLLVFIASESHAAVVNVQVDVFPFRTTLSVLRLLGG
jgi:hypothetical protein